MGNGADVYGGSSNAFGGSGGLSANYGDGIFGDGYDGDVTITNTVTLSKETYYNNLTITGTGTLKPAGFRFFVKGTLTIQAGGSINDDGNDAVGGTQGAALTSRQTLGGGSGAGGSGATQGAGVGGGNSGGSSSLNGAGLAPVGGTGGAATNVGGLGGSATQPVQNQRWNGTSWLQMGRFNNGTASALYNGGSGGGSGGSDAVTALSGGGGGGGGLVWLAAKYIINNGRISANGGKGGNGTGTAGNAGGGGGGAAGNVCVGTLSYPIGLVTATGGAGGTGFGTGGAGTVGRDGSVNIVVLA